MRNKLAHPEWDLFDNQLLRFLLAKENNFKLICSELKQINNILKRHLNNYDWKRRGLEYYLHVDKNVQKNTNISLENIGVLNKTLPDSGVYESYKGKQEIKKRLRDIINQAVFELEKMEGFLKGSGLLELFDQVSFEQDMFCIQHAKHLLDDLKLSFPNNKNLEYAIKNILKYYGENMVLMLPRTSAIEFGHSNYQKINFSSLLKDLPSFLKQVVDFGTQCHIYYEVEQNSSLRRSLEYQINKIYSILNVINAETTGALGELELLEMRVQRNHIEHGGVFSDLLPQVPVLITYVFKYLKQIKLKLETLGSISGISSDSDEKSQEMNNPNNNFKITGGLRPLEGLFDNLDRKQNKEVHEQAKSKILEHITKMGYELGKAIGKGDCFFDAVGQGLLRKNIVIISSAQRRTSVDKSLRQLCEKYAKVNQKNDTHWLKRQLGKEHQNYLITVGYTAPEVEDMYRRKLLPSEAARWGAPDIDGRIICDVLNVRLHIMELIEVEGQIVINHQLIDADGSKQLIGDKQITEIYNDNRVIHLAGYQHALHWVPVYKTQSTLEISLSRQVTSTTLPLWNGNLLREYNLNKECIPVHPNSSIILQNGSSTSLDEKKQPPQIESVNKVNSR